MDVFTFSLYIYPQIIHPRLVYILSIHESSIHNLHHPSIYNQYSLPHSLPLFNPAPLHFPLLERQIHIFLFVLISKIIRNKSSNSGDFSHGFDEASHGDYSYAQALFEVWLVAMDSFCGKEHGYGLIFLIK